MQHDLSARVASAIRESGIPLRQIALGTKLAKNTVSKVASGAIDVRYVTLLRVSEWLAANKTKTTNGKIT